MSTRKPAWLKVRMPGGEHYTAIKARARNLRLHTVCEEAQCPNVGECWGSGTATFMVMGNVCTRGCRFCAVDTRRHGPPLDPEEPANVAHAVVEMQINYVVLTSVDRDDLPDQGAHHFAACVRAIRAARPSTRVEVLIPDFQGDLELVRRVVNAGPDVVAHNVECTEALTSLVRDPRAGYQQSLDVLAGIKATPRPQGPMLTKSSIMVGLGEPEADVVQTMRDLRQVGCDFLTVGQYLRPSARHLPVIEYVSPEQFDRYRESGLSLGFEYVAAGPLVRSSYRAGEMFMKRFLERRDAGRAALETAP